MINQSINQSINRHPDPLGIGMRILYFIIDYCVCFLLSVLLFYFILLSVE